MENQIGKVIKSYQLEGLLGTGGFGAVYRAKQAVVDREVAIKIIWPAFANHPNFIRRFEAEAQLVAGLEHPYIVPLYDYWRDPEGAYIVMRLLRGGALRDLMTGEQWALPEINRLVNQIASALALAHRYGVVHRDIKPENILLDEDRNAYLADFGIAQIVGAVQENGNDFLAGMGSPAYAPPEQISGGITSSQSDIYSLSVIIYELITGEHPFPELEDLSVTEMNELRSKASLPPIMGKRNDVSRTLNDVLQKASALDPKDRFADAMSFARAFHEASGNSGRLYSATRVIASGEVIPNPYKGLRAFQETDAANFFGRAALINRLINRMKEDSPYSRFLAIVGPSGSGKSSVVRAGLIPQLREGAVSGGDNWYYDQVIPGEQPFSEIENAIVSLAVDPPENLSERLLASEQGMFEAFNEVLPDDESEFLLFIDQFEEVFTLTENESDVSKFLQSLYTAVTHPDSRMRIIITIRADFYDKPLLQPRLSDMVRERTEVVVPLSPSELERVIMEPARRAGVMIDHGLVASIVAEVKEQPGSLPLLQYTLSELFERRDGSVITTETYRQLGGVRGALANRAQEIIDALTEEETRAVRQLFLRLITLGEGTEDTRRRALITEITSIRDDEDFTDSESVMRRVVNLLGDARLLTFDRDPVTRSPTVEVTHEAIIREWETLRGWLDESRTDVRMQRTLANLANEWDNNHRDNSFLMRGVRLDSYEKWIQDTNVALTLTETDYVQTSVRARQERELYEAEREARERKLEQRALNRTRILALVLSIATIGALLLSGYAFYLSNQARAASEISQSIAWEASARQALAEDNTDLAVLLAMQAVEMENPPPQALSTLSEVAYSEGTSLVLTGHEARVQDVAFSPDGTLIVSASTDASVKIWDVATGTILHNLTAHAGDVESVTFSPDGRFLISTATDFFAILWDVQTGAEIRRFQTFGNPVRDAAFTPDGTQLMTVSNSGLVILWDIATGSEIRRFEGHGVATVLSIAMHPDENFAISGGRDASMFLWNIDAGTGIELAGHNTQINDVEYDSTGSFVVSASGDGAIIVWDAATGAMLAQFSGSFEEVRDIEISPDGQLVYAASITGAIQVFDVETGLVVERLLGHRDSALGLSMSYNGQLLVSGSIDTTIRLWNVGFPGAEQFYAEHSGRVQDLVISPDGQRIYSVSVDSTLVIWDANAKEATRRFVADDALFSVDIASDESFAILGSRGRIFIVNLIDGSIQSIESNSGRINDVIVFADNTRALTAGTENIVIMWNLETGAEIRRFEGHEDGVNGITLLPNGTEFVSASADGTLRRWNIDTGEQLAIYEGHEGIVSSVASNPDGTQIISGGRDGFAILWDVASSEELVRIVVGVPAIWSVDFNETGNRVVISGELGTILVWDVNNNSEVERFNIGATNVFSVKFAPDGRKFISGQDNNSVIVWRMYGLEELVQWVRDNRYLRAWDCVEIEQYRLPEDTPCESQ